MVLGFASGVGGLVVGGGRGVRSGLKSRCGRRSVLVAALAEKPKVEVSTHGEDGNGVFANDDSLKWEAQIGYEVVDDKTGLPLRYDGATIRKYWDKRPVELQSRWTFFLGVVVPFGTKLLRNLTAGTIEKNQRELARDFRIVLERLGPTFVKLGQVLSIRPDIVGRDASDELALLQDAVPVFPTAIAREVIEEELGQKLEDVFSDFSDEPVAAASLAQVYQATLKSTGQKVAIKVQRPGLLPIVTKDLYVMRRGVEWAEPIRKRFSAERTNYMELLNTWAGGFYEELDFKNEAYNQIQFKELLVKSDIQNVIVPEVFEEYSSRRLLVSEWIDGVKLTQADPEEIEKLVDVGNSAFLTQLLDWGVFHGDPHPGNLLVTPEGKLCILDFGLMANIPGEDRNKMVSAVIHVANKDFGQLVDDLIDLKFLPNDVDRPKVETVMGKVLGPFVYQGGGAKNVDFRSLARDLAGVTREIPFSIPPYYALVGRAIISLEGIALQADPDYRLVMEAYPYVARRVMSEDDTPELQKALAEILYKDGGFSVNRLAALLNSAMGYVGMSKDAIVDFDSIPEDGATASKFVEFILSNQSKSIRSTLSVELAKAIDIVLRRMVRLRTSEILSSMNRVPAPFRIGYNSVSKANELSAIRKDEELYVDSLIALSSQLLGVDVRGAIDEPFKALSMLRQLSSNPEIQESLRVVSANRGTAETFAQDIAAEVQKVGSRRLYDEYLPATFPGLIPAFKAATTTFNSLSLRRKT